MKRTTLKTLVWLAPLAAGVCQTAFADPIPYPNAGQVAPTVVLAGGGSDVVAYFAGSGAGGYEQVGMYVNGVLSSAGFVFPNHVTASGAKIDLGFAPAGADLVFALQVYDTNLGNYPTDTSSAGTGNLHYIGPASYTVYSVPSDVATGFTNSDGSNHAYITPFTATDVSAKIPVTGTYIGFEDLLTNGTSGIPSDLNYTDEQFVISGAASVPEPSGLVCNGVPILGVLGLALAARRRTRKA